MKKTGIFIAILLTMFFLQKLPAANAAAACMCKVNIKVLGVSALADLQNSQCPALGGTFDVLQKTCFSANIGVVANNEAECVGVSVDKIKNAISISTFELVGSYSCGWIDDAQTKPQVDNVDVLKTQAASGLNPAGFGEVPDFIGTFLKFLMGIIGSVILALYVYAGFLWMTATGNAERVGKAKTIVIWTTLGTVVMFGSYTLIRFIYQALELSK